MWILLFILQMVWYKVQNGMPVNRFCFGYHFVDSTVNACIVRPEVGLKLKTINEVYAATTHSNYYLCTKIQFCIPSMCSIVNYNESKRRKTFIHTLVASI